MKTDAPAIAPPPKPQPGRVARLLAFLEVHAIAVAATAMVTISAVRLLVMQA